MSSDNSSSSSVWPFGAEYIAINQNKDTDTKIDHDEDENVTDSGLPPWKPVSRVKTGTKEAEAAIPAAEVKRTEAILAAAEQGAYQKEDSRSQTT